MFSCWRKYNKNTTLATSKCNTTFCPSAETNNNNLTSIFFLLPWLTASIKTISLCEGWETQQIIAVACLLSGKCFYCFSVIADIFQLKNAPERCDLVVSLCTGCSKVLSSSCAELHILRTKQKPKLKPSFVRRLLAAQQWDFSLGLFQGRQACPPRSVISSHMIPTLLFHVLLQSSVLRRSSILTYWSLNVTEQLQLHYHLHLCSWVNSAHHTGVIQIPGHSCCNFIITVLHQNPEELIQDYRKEIHNHMDLLNPQQILWRR